MKKHILTIMASMILVLSTLVGCSSSVETTIENATIQDLADKYTIINDNVVVMAFDTIGVTNTISHSGSFKDGTGYFAVTDENNNEYKVLCTNFIATDVLDKDGNVLITIDTTDEEHPENNYIHEEEEIDISDLDVNNDPIVDVESLIYFDPEIHQSVSYDYVTISETNRKNILQIGNTFKLNNYVSKSGETMVDIKDSYENTLQKLNEGSDEPAYICDNIFIPISECLIGSIPRSNEDIELLMKQAAVLSFWSNKNMYVNKCLYDNETGDYYFFFYDDDETKYHIIYNTSENNEKIIINGKDQLEAFKKLYNGLQ